MKRTGIIGGGFSGTMTVVHLINKTTRPAEIIIVTEGDHIARGIAFKPYSKQHLLNVPAASMSAFADDDDHFMQWLMQQPDFKDKEISVIGGSFIPRYLYGKYLTEIWEHALQTAAAKNVTVRIINNTVEDLAVSANDITLNLQTGENITVDNCVIATGNHVPANPRIIHPSFYNSRNYYQNPWEERSVAGLENAESVLIIGNGLTMVDTVLGLLEKKFKGVIYSVSPNGFNILPHRHAAIKYSKLTDALPQKATLYELIKLFNLHKRKLKLSGISPEPLVDSLRPYSQNIWQQLTAQEKAFFMKKLRHMWGVVRSRIPAHIHDKLQQLRIENTLRIYAGRITDIQEEDGIISVSFYNKKTKSTEQIQVARVINCSGPDTDLMRMEKDFLKNCVTRGIAVQDELKLGINARPDTFEVLNKDGFPHANLFTIGSNLKGVLWESIAVNELREQAQNVAAHIISLNQLTGISSR